MKTLFAFFLIILSASRSFALSDLERGILFLGNAYAYGTLLPDIEGRIAVKKLEYEKKKAEFRHAQEQNRQIILKNLLAQEQEHLSEFKDFLLEQRSLLENKQSAFNRVVIMAQNLYVGLDNKESLAKELNARSPLDPELAADWQNLLTETVHSEIQNLSTDQFEEVLSAALETQAIIETRIENIQTHLDVVDFDLNQITKRLASL